jgi:hypothetical protein
VREKEREQREGGKEARRALRALNQARSGGGDLPSATFSQEAAGSLRALLFGAILALKVSQGRKKGGKKKGKGRRREGKRQIINFSLAAISPL